MWGVDAKAKLSLMFGTTSRPKGPGGGTNPKGVSFLSKVKQLRCCFDTANHDQRVFIWRLIFISIGS